MFWAVKAFYNPAKPSEAEPEEEPIMTRLVTFSELREAKGEEGKALFIAVKDPFGTDITVFDVSSGKDFYGPGGPYHMFAGQNATYGLAKSSTDPSQVNGNLSTLSMSEKDTHAGWYSKYMSKYPVVGKLVPDDYVPPPEEPAADTADSKKDA